MYCATSQVYVPPPPRTSAGETMYCDLVILCTLHSVLCTVYFTYCILCNISQEMAAWVSTVSCLLVLSAVFTGLEAQAPGDEDNRCTVDHDSPPTYADNVKPLMDSYHYKQLLPGSGTGNPPIEGAVWTDRSVDGNDVVDNLNPTYVSLQIMSTVLELYNTMREGTEQPHCQTLHM